MPALASLVVLAAAHAVWLVVTHRTYFAQSDNSLQFWAWYQKAASVLHSGAFPLWDANTLAGHSFVGETQTGVFYPLNIFWLLVFGSAHGISARALDMLVEFHLLIALLGFYALARSLRLSRLPAVIAAVVFAYTGALFARTTGQTAIFFGLTWIPWALFCAHRQLETGRLRWALGAGAAIGLGVLAGHFQPPFHAALIVALFYVLALPLAGRGWRAELWPRALGLLTTAAAALLVALPQLVYSLPYLDRAYRFIGAGPPIPPGGSVSFQVFTTQYTGAPDTVLSMLDPIHYPVQDGNELFMGLGALAVLLVALFAYRRAIVAPMGRYRWAIAGVGLIGALAMLGPWTFFPRILYELPLVTEVRELGRYAIMVHLTLCLLLAGALEALARGWLSAPSARTWRRDVITSVVGGLVSINGVYLIAHPIAGEGRWFGTQLLLAGVVLLVLAGARPITDLVTRLRPAMAVPVLVLIAIPIAWGSLHNGTRFLGSTSSAFYPAKYYARTPEITYVESACAGHRTVAVGSALPTNVADVYRDIRTVNGYGATVHVPYLAFQSNTPFGGPEQTRLLDERCIVTKGTLSVRGYHLGYRNPTDGVSVYVNDHTSPLNTPAFHPIPVAVLHQRDRDLLYEVNLSQWTTAIVSAIVYPGWTLKVDGQSVHTETFKVAGVAIFPEVILPPGRHKVQYSWSGWPS